VQERDKEFVLSVRVIDPHFASMKLISISSTVQGYPGYSTTTVG